MSCYEVIRNGSGEPVKIVDAFTKKRVPPDEEAVVLVVVARSRRRLRAIKKIAVRVGAN